MRTALLVRRALMFALVASAPALAACGGGGGTGGGAGEPAAEPATPREPVTLEVGPSADGTHTPPLGFSPLSSTRAGLTGNDPESLAVGDAPFFSPLGRGNERSVGSFLRFPLTEAPAGRRLVSATLVLIERGGVLVNLSLRGLGTHLRVQHLVLARATPSPNDMLDLGLLDTPEVALPFSLLGGGPKSADVTALVAADLEAGRETCDLRLLAQRVVADEADTLVKFFSSEEEEESRRPRLVLTFE